MKLEHLYKDILDMTDSELSAFIVQYSDKRQDDLTRLIPADDPFITDTPTPARKPRISGTKLSLSPEELEILRKLKLI